MAHFYEVYDEEEGTKSGVCVSIDPGFDKLSSGERGEFNVKEFIGKFRSRFPGKFQYTALLKSVLSKEASNAIAFCFALGVQPDRKTKWKPLSAKTIANRLRKQNPSKKPLIETGVMLASLMKGEEVEKGNGDPTYQAQFHYFDGKNTQQYSATTGSTKTKIIFGTTVPYASIHQFGTRKIPKRKFLPESIAEFKLWVPRFGKVAHKAILKAIREYKKK